MSSDGGSDSDRGGSPLRGGVVRQPPETRRLNLIPGQARRPRTSIARLMRWVAGIALLLATLRSDEALFTLCIVIGFVVASVATYATVRKVNRGLIESRNGSPTRPGRAFEVGLVILCGLFAFIFAFFSMSFVVGFVCILVGGGFPPPAR